MADTDTQIEQQDTADESSRTYHRDEDGRFASPPAESKEQGEASNPVEKAVGESSAKTADAPAQPSQDDIDRREYDRLKAKHESSEKRTSEPSSPSKSTETPSSLPGATPGQTPQPGADVPSPAQATENKLPDEYKQVLTVDQYTLLKRVGWLLPVDQVKEMGVEALADTIRAARAYRSELDRDFQQKQQRPSRQTATEVIPSGEGIAPQDFGQVPPGQGQTVQRVRLPDEVESHLQTVATEYGDDSPVYLAMRRNEEVRQLQLQQLFQQRQVDSAALQQAVFRTAEDNAFSGLQSQFPKLKDASEREELRTLARAHANAMFNIGRTDVTPQQAVQFVAQARYFPQIREQERNRLTEDRSRSLSASVERGTPVAKPVQRMSADERDKYIYDQLRAGKKREQVLAEMR